MLNDLFLILLKGSAGSGNWAHPGNPPNLGGSGPGGGLGKLRLPPTSTVDERKRESYAISGSARKYPFVSPAEIRKHYNLTDNCSNFPSECKALKRYTGLEYHEINNKLRSGESLGVDLNKTVDRIDTAFKKLPKVPKNMTVIRNIDDFVVNQMEVGKVFRDNGFTSTSVDGSYGKKLTIRVPKGAKGIYVDEISHYSGEKELLLPRSSKFRVLSKDEYGNAILELILDN